MTDSFNKTISDKFLINLQNELTHLSNRSDNENIKFLLKLVRCKLDDTSFNSLLKEEKSNLIHLNIELNNSELIARINDIKFINNDKDKLQCLEIAVENYIKTYSSTNEIIFFIRALELVKKVKNLFDLLYIESKIIQEFKKLNSTYFQLELIKKSLSLLQKNTIDYLIEYTLNEIQNKHLNHKYDDSIKLIEILKLLKYYNANEANIQIAICLEKKADHQTTEKKPNTYYPNILLIYTNALKRIKGIARNEELENRLQIKIKKEQLLNYEMLTKSKFDIIPSSTLNVSEMFSSLDITDFFSAYINFINFPLIENEKVNSILNERKKTIFNQFFEEYVKITNKGTIGGKSNEDTFYQNTARDYNRENVILILREFKTLMDKFSKPLSKKEILDFLIDENSIFIPNDRLNFYVEGIYQGFLNNFVVASHILVPQIENSLKHIIELNERNTIKLGEDIQHDNTLGSILKVENNNKMLNGICHSDLLTELNCFLCDGNSVNFRNQLCHGLISYAETNHYGLYLWWLTLKMITQTNTYFTIPH